MIARTTRRPGTAAFTLIELLVVIAIVGVLIGLLIPAVQAVREAANRAAAKSRLGALRASAEAYRQTVGSYPGSRDELADFCRRHPGLCATGAVLAAVSGTGDGYLYSLSSDADGRLALQAVPAFPGRTGAETLSMDATGTVHSLPTPGADAERAAMLAAVFVAGAEAAAGLVGETPSLLRQALQPDGTAVHDALERLDADGDGELTVREILRALAAEPALAAFAHAVGDEMRLGAAGENVAALPGVDIAPPDADTDWPSLATDTGVCRLATAYVTRPGLARSLCRKAHRIGVARDDRMCASRLRGLVRQADREVGRTLTVAQAATLERLAGAL